MASNGLLSKAKKGTCRMCLRCRNTENQVKAVGEVRRGYATGHIWECIDTAECDIAAKAKLADPNISGIKRASIENAQERGRLKYWTVVT